MTEFDNFIQEIKQKRDTGQHFIVVKPLDDMAPIAEQHIDDLAGMLGLNPTSGWSHSIEEHLAVEILTELMHRDMAYHAELMPRQEAWHLARRFFDFFNGPKRYFTNAQWRGNRGSLRLDQWIPLTSHTFDAGIMILTETHFGCLWFGDED